LRVGGIFETSKMTIQVQQKTTILMETGENQMVLGLTMHRKLGFLLTPYLVERRNDTTALQIITPIYDAASIKNYALNHKESQLLQITNQYSDRRIASSFSRKMTVVNFFNQLQEETIQNHIRPFIERKLLKCLELIRNMEIQVYVKEESKKFFETDDRITYSSEDAMVMFNFNKSKDTLTYHLSIRHNANDISFYNQKIIVLTQEPCNILLNKDLYCLQNINSKKILPFTHNKAIIVPPTTFQKYFETFVLKTIVQYPTQIVSTGFSITEHLPERKPALSLEKDLMNDAVLLIRFYYGKKEFLYNNPKKLIVTLRKTQRDDLDWYEYTKVYRDTEWERNCIKQLVKLGLVPTKEGYFKLNSKQQVSGEPDELIEWINTNSKKLHKRGFEIVQNYYVKKYYTGNVRIEYRLRSDSQHSQDWFDLFAEVQLGNFKIPFIKLKKHILEEIKEFKLPNNEYLVIPTHWFAKYRSLMQFGDDKSGYIRLNPHHHQLIEQEITNDTTVQLPVNITFTQPDKQQLQLPKSLNATLRPYQIEGYNWLYSLYKNKLCGCLADDMGLGKTVQTISILLKIIEEKKQRVKAIAQVTERATNNQLTIFDILNSTETKQNTVTDTNASLIVVPKSLIGNWINEIKRFAPSLRVYTHTGTERTIKSKYFSNYDIVITSYTMLRMDFEMLVEYRFLAIILDESQYIKNPDSQIYKSIIALNSEFRLTLTGTPIENSLTDLWSQLNFLNRGILGDLTFFKTEFVTPIQKQGCSQSELRLKELIRPFVLRRTKNEVAIDLPALTEQMIYCEMEDTQRLYYETEKAKIKNQLLELLDEDKEGKKGVVMIQGLMRLRQMANHPLIVDDSYDGQSTKFEQIIQFIESIIAEDHKILIFSNFRKHLDLFARHFDRSGWRYTMLTGKTENRSKVIDEFQQNDEIRLFLITLKAGGVGLNLTAADYIFIIDPWWNMSAENQAISRAHRIGQRKNVFVYRFITSASIEEKILILKEKKQIIADTFINNNSLTGLDTNEIFWLFE